MTEVNKLQEFGSLAIDDSPFVPSVGHLALQIWVKATKFIEEDRTVDEAYLMIPASWTELLQRIKPFGGTDIDSVLREAGALTGFSAAKLEHDGRVIGRFGGMRDFGEGQVYDLPHCEGTLAVLFDSPQPTDAVESIKAFANALDLALLVHDRRSGFDSVPMMEPMGTKDRLTKTIDRDAFTDFLDIEFAGGPTDATVILLGVDGMDNVNATLGHAVGDAVLSEVANRLRETLRDFDTVSRLGGDVFGVYCPSMGVDTATNLARRLQAAIHIPIRVQDNELRISAGVGVASRDRGEKAAEIIAHGDAALSASKAQGPGELSVYDGEIQMKSNGQRQLAAELLDALASNQLTTGLVPIVHLPAGTVVGLEAHVIWKHPVRGQINDNQFMNLAELIGRVGDVERAVLEYAMLDDGSDGGVRTGMSLSASTLRDSRAIGWIVDRLASGPNKIMFQVNEEAVSAGGRVVTNNLEMLRHAGASLVLDDFGRSHASLRTLHAIPFDGVKLHSSILDWNDRTRSASVIKAVYASAKELDFDVVHSGVDTDADLRLLLDLNSKLSGGRGFFAQGVAVQARVSVARSA